MVKFTNELIANHKPNFEKDATLEKSCLSIQSVWRGHLARQKYSLFGRLQASMKQGNVHSISTLNNIKNCIDNNKLHEAKISLSRLTK
ncbi:MAG: IQ calmodulin-binding motif-containing protein [Gammaproteobacteria bacterium]|nr:IQ calmodulin-binding motif-containing protein [Gammaproteobacteria bacterium]